MFSTSLGTDDYLWPTDASKTITTVFGDIRPFRYHTGIDIRTIVSGIAAYYQPEDILGMQVSVLVNLAPRNIKGIESQGMVLMAEDKDGTLQFVASSEGSSNGSIIA